MICPVCALEKCYLFYKSAMKRHYLCFRASDIFLWCNWKEIAAHWCCFALHVCCILSIDHSSQENEIISLWRASEDLQQGNWGPVQSFAQDDIQNDFFASSEMQKGHLREYIVDDCACVCFWHILFFVNSATLLSRNARICVFFSIRVFLKCNWKGITSK